MSRIRHAKFRMKAHDIVMSCFSKPKSPVLRCTMFCAFDRIFARQSVHSQQENVSTTQTNPVVALGHLQLAYNDRITQSE